MSKPFWVIASFPYDKEGNNVLLSMSVGVSKSHQCYILPPPKEKIQSEGLFLALVE